MNPLRQLTATLLLCVLLLGGCANPFRREAPPHPVTPAVPPVVVAPAPPPPPVPPAPPRPPQVLIEPAQVLQGDIATLTLDGAVSGAVTADVDGLNDLPKVYAQEGRVVAFIGFPAAVRVGNYPVTVTWEGGEWQGSIAVIRKEFTEDRLVVTQEQEAIFYDPRAAAEWRRLFAVRANSHPEPLWTGPFRAPLAGPLRVTTYFGEIRFVNGQETGRHSGIDYGAPTGTPILSPARGRVVMAELLIVTGWTIIIDHGVNLFSVYYHADRVDVAPGQMVQSGDVIGTVGSTGFSTGPHLHWTMTIGNTPVDPWPLTLTAPLGIWSPLEPGVARE